MLNLSEENKALCFSDSVSKPLYIFLYYWQEVFQDGVRTGYWQYFKTIDEAIVLESMSIDEGILEGNTFELGSFIVPTIKVKWRNDGIRYKDMVAVPVQKIGTQYIAYFDGYISSEEIENNGQTVSAEIVSFLGERLNIDVLGTVKAYNGGTFYEMVQNALGQTADIWIKGSETDELLKKFPNANTVITLDENTLPKTLTASELLKQSGEFLGAHIILKEKRIVNIDDMTRYNPGVTPTIDFIRISNVDDIATTNSIETYTLPYYINIFSDKKNRLKFDALNVFTEVGKQRLYTKFWNESVYNTFEIKNNIFFNALSSQSPDACFSAVDDVASYVANQNFYQSDIECIYPLFIEGGDYLIIKSKNQSLLPNEYLVLDNITLSDENGPKYIDTHIHPNSDDIELNIEFALLSRDSSIFSADARDEFYDTLSLHASSNSLFGSIGYYGGSIQLLAFEIPNVPLNQKINFNLKCGKGKYQYSGAFIGNGGYFGGDKINTGNVSLKVGSSGHSGYKLYHFAYSQNGVKMCDMYPCIRKSDGVVGVYDIVQNIFEPISGSANSQYETGDIVVPVLSATTRGIHSMRTNVLCKAVNSNNK